MRRWLIHKKQNISQSIQLEDDREAREAQAIEETIRTVVEKAEFLILLQLPKLPFKTENKLDLETGISRVISN